ncbi:MAG: GNAT family protein [Nostoc sp.]|uniref:GNAT family N-acetyltransferase n=1 Tax=Nostoc sp. TaxID=1180 RepID=UPI002FFD31CE
MKYYSDTAISKELKIRYANRSDIKAILSWLNNKKNLMLFQEFYLEDIEEWFDLSEKGKEKLFILSDDNLEFGFVSIVGIDQRNYNCQLGRLIISNESMKGQGYGTLVTQLLLNYAFEQLNMHKVSVRVGETNIASIKCVLNSGFRFMGRERDGLFRGEYYVDMLDFDILINEWNEFQKKLINNNPKVEFI